MSGAGERLTAAMREALDLAVTRGAVYAGHDQVRGRLVRTSASTLRAMERRGLLTIRLSPDGGMVGEPTAAGRALITTEVSS